MTTAVKMGSDTSYSGVTTTPPRETEQDYYRALREAQSRGMYLHNLWSPRDGHRYWLETWGDNDNPRERKVIGKYRTLRAVYYVLGLTSNEEA